MTGMVFSNIVTGLIAGAAVFPASAAKNNFLLDA